IVFLTAQRQRLIAEDIQRFPLFSRLHTATSFTAMLYIIHYFTEIVNIFLSFIITLLQNLS
ncbi:MAG: hypothetical protein VZR73_09415, partial [Acutalibacteraceae bacterium]|nr:hypothetical protein [Acutalibacteraceae bacterium]